MRVLITGAAGYIGSHLVRAMAPYHELVAVDNLTTGFRDALPSEVEFHGIDVRDEEALAVLLRRRGIECVIHLAASACARASAAAPGEYFDNNVVGGLRLLQAMTAAGTRLLVFSSSCSVYGSPESLPVNETAAIRPVSPYGESKAAVERFASWFGRAHGLRTVALRYFNAAGADPGARCGERHDPETHIVPLLLAAAHEGRTFTLLGDDFPTPDGTAIRDYVHVSDIASAHAITLDYLARGGETAAVNLGAGEGTSARQLIGVVERITGRRVAVKCGRRDPADPAQLVASCELAASLLGWRPQHSRLEEIVSTADSWGRKYCQQGAAARAVGAV